MPSVRRVEVARTWKTLAAATLTAVALMAAALVAVARGPAVAARPK